MYKLTLLIYDNHLQFRSKYLSLEPPCILFTIMHISGKYYLVFHFVIKFLACHTEVLFALELGSIHSISVSDYTFLMAENMYFAGADFPGPERTKSVNFTTLRRGIFCSLQCFKYSVPLAVSSDSFFRDVAGFVW